MRRRRLAAFISFLLILPAACGNTGNGGGGGGTPETTGAATPESSPSETQAPGQPVGELIQVIESLARIGGERAAGGDRLFEGSVVTTDDRGRATFSVREILEDCQIQADSRLTVAPSPRTPLELDQGSLICRSKPGEDEFQIEAGQAIVGFLDPIFLLNVGGSKTDVGVDFGFVQVRKAASNSRAMIVGPGGQVSVGAGSLPARADSFNAQRLDRFNSEALRRLRAPLPQPPSGFPRSSSSQALRGISSAKKLRIAVDEEANRRTDGKAERFAGALLGVIGRRWGVGLEAGSLDREDAGAQLQGGQMDAFVSPGPVPGAARIVLFGDDSEQDWFLWVRPDISFQSSLEEMLKAILNNGEYAQAYTGAFKRQPTYQTVRSLVYPSRAQVNRTQWLAPTEVVESPSASPTGSPSFEGSVSRVSLQAQPEQYEGDCPVQISFEGEIVIDKPGVVRYEYLTSRRTSLGRRSTNFDDAGTFRLPPQTLSVPESATGWVRVQVLDQNVQSPQAFYEVACTVIVE